MKTILLTVLLFSARHAYAAAPNVQCWGYAYIFDDDAPRNPDGNVPPIKDARLFEYVVTQDTPIEEVIDDRPKHPVVLSIEIEKPCPPGGTVCRGGLLRAAISSGRAEASTIEDTEKDFYLSLAFRQGRAHAVVSCIPSLKQI